MQRKIPFGRVAAGPKGPKPPPESIDAWWHPARPGVRLGPSWFRSRLNEVDGELDLTWNPYKQQYQVFMKAPRMQHKICWGWAYLFPVKPDELDNRVFHRLYHASARKWGSAKQYFDAVERELIVEREKARAAQMDDTLERAMDFYRHTQISTAGSGNKFSQWHS